MTIKEAIQNLAKDSNRHRTSLYLAEVLSVNEDERTCEVVTVSGDSELTIPSASLVSEGSDGFIQIPSVGSIVLIGHSLEVGYSVLQFSDIDKVLTNQDEFIFNGGDNGGLIIIAKLVSRMNAIEDAFSQHVLWSTTHTHASPPAPVNPVVTTPPIVPSTSNAGRTVRKDLENPKIKH